MGTGDSLRGKGERKPAGCVQNSIGTRPRSFRQNDLQMKRNKAENPRVKKFAQQRRWTSMVQILQIQEDSDYNYVITLL